MPLFLTLISIFVRLSLGQRGPNLMDIYKIKVKIGENEFEAEGPRDVVQSQFESFREMIASASTHKETTLPPAAGSNEVVFTGQPPDLNRIMQVNGRVVSLTAPTKSAENAALLILFGQKMWRANEAVTGGEIKEGLHISGMRLDRIDRMLEKMADEGTVMKIGAHRASRYRLTSPGIAKANEIAKELVALVG